MIVRDLVTDLRQMDGVFEVVFVADIGDGIQMSFEVTSVEEGDNGEVWLGGTLVD
jgi:hypothetical protein